jgi:hypothetical protein
VKHVKMVGLAVVTAVALAAFLGAGLASATVLCKTATSPCTSKYPAGTKIHAILQEGTSLVKKSDDLSKVVDTCPESTIQWQTSNEGSSTEAVNAALTTWTLGMCSWPNAVEVLGSVEIRYDSKTGVTSVVGKSTRITENVNFLLHCIYSFGSGTSLGTLTKPATATSDTFFHMNATINRLTGSNEACAASTVWQATYTVTSPVPLYVTGS